jgi:hypothetical protein
VLIDIFDYQDVVVLKFPPDVPSREISAKLAEECGDAASFFRPSGIAVDLTGTAVSNLLFMSIYFLTSLGRKWGYRVALAGKKAEMETLLTTMQIFQYTAGCYDTVQEAIDVLRLPPSAA